MTTLTLSQIPSNINTLEKLHLWSGLALRSLNSANAVTEASGLLPEIVAQVPLIETPNHGVRTVIRVCIELDSNYANDKTKKLWEFAKELTGGTLPTGNWTTN
jgi:hypothetical protein